MNSRLVNDRFPYVPIIVTVDASSMRFDALLDTGFDGDLVAPRSVEAIAGIPNGIGEFSLADGSEVRCPIYFGTVEIGALGTFPVEIAALGDECLMGRGLSDRFSITLDHGRQIVVEP